MRGDVQNRFVTAVPEPAHIRSDAATFQALITLAERRERLDHLAHRGLQRAGAVERDLGKLCLSDHGGDVPPGTLKPAAGGRCIGGCSATLVDVLRQGPASFRMRRAMLQAQAGKAATNLPAAYPSVTPPGYSRCMSEATWWPKGAGAERARTTSRPSIPRSPGSLDRDYEEGV